MGDYTTTVRNSLIQATELAREEFGLADVAIVGRDNISDYPYWNVSVKRKFKEKKNHRSYVHMRYLVLAKEAFY